MFIKRLTMCGVCCKCEWLGSVEVPYYTCCGELCSSSQPVCTYMAFCSEPNEHKCRNCMLCAAPCLLTTITSSAIGILELFCLTTCGCCGGLNGHCCEGPRLYDTVQTKGFPSMSEVEPLYTRFNESRKS